MHLLQHLLCKVIVHHAIVMGNFMVADFFAVSDAKQLNAVTIEWHSLKHTSLSRYWPKSEVYKYEHGNTSMLYNQPAHGYTHWWKMFNHRQIRTLAEILRSIDRVVEKYGQEVTDIALGAFQQYLRNQCLYCFWNIAADKLEPLFSNNNYHPKSVVIENGVFSNLGRGNWSSQVKNLLKACEWKENPWEIVNNQHLKDKYPHIGDHISGKSEKANCGDPIINNSILTCQSSTDLKSVDKGTFDLVITDPPFSALLHYADLADFFYVWMQLILSNRPDKYFAGISTPRALEAVANRGLYQNNADNFYQRILTECWIEGLSLLKPGGLLAFTFHHSDDRPWVTVLESLLDAGFYLEATYPIRSDETKGAGSKPGTFGSQKIEYDIIHVCRKLREEPKPISWAKLRRQVLRDVRDLQNLSEHH